MKCLCAIHVDRNQQTFLEQMMSFVVWYDVIYHSLPIISQYLMIGGGGEVDSPDHVTCKWLPTRKVCSCMMSSNWRVWLQMIFCSCKNETVLFSSLGSLMRENGRSLCFPKRFWLKNKLSDRMCLADQCLADQLFLCPPLKHRDIFRLPSSIISKF